ncbi:gamma-glutamyl hydrolase 2 [Actinidia rufa]|uniref:folate gamma-glutamyl hydrolase n=1 Tax=Actinidia rufa TaxID=165716 RepID=A0A7J0G2R3_9ERIC|nr:gamma-glutamyl hydrolase 2 [Actinidia rufa]
MSLPSLSNSISNLPDSASNHPSPPPSAAPASSQPPRYSDMWSYLWIPLLISLSKELSAELPGAGPQTQFPAGDRDPQPPGDGASGRLNSSADASYIAASYVKFVEAAGARVIPLIYNEPPEILYQKLDLVNGVLFTGGWAKTGPYVKVVEGIFKKVLEKNDAGDHFPLVAICLGFEILTMIISKVSYYHSS